MTIQEAIEKARVVAELAEHDGDHEAAEAIRILITGHENLDRSASHALYLVSELCGVFSHPYFTDRCGYAERCHKVADALRTALVGSKSEGA